MANVCYDKLLTEGFNWFGKGGAVGGRRTCDHEVVAACVTTLANSC